MNISRKRLNSAIRCLREGLLHLQKGNLNTTAARISSAKNLLENKIRCPKCDSEDVLLGNKEEPNHCADCNHEWSRNKDNCNEQVLSIKDQKPLATINYKPQSLDDRLDSALRQL